MSKSILDDIWSIYTISPDPISGTPTLRDICAALLSYTLSSSDIIPGPAGFVLHPRLANPLRQSISDLKRLTASLGQPHVVDSTDSRIALGPTSLDWKVQVSIPTTSSPVSASWWVASGTPYKSSKSFFKDMSRTSEITLAKRAPTCGPAGSVGNAFIQRFPNAPASLRALHAAPALAPGPLHPPTPSFPSTAHTFPASSAPQRDVPARQASRTVEYVLDKGVTRAETAPVNSGVIPARWLVSAQAECMSSHEYILGAHLPDPASPLALTPAARTPSDEMARTARPAESAPRREVPSRQAGRAVEEIFDDVATCRAKIAPVDEHLDPATELVVEQAGSAGTHQTASPIGSPDWRATTRAPSLSSPSPSCSSDSGASWRSTIRVASPASMSTSWRSKIRVTPASSTVQKISSPRRGDISAWETRAATTATEEVSGVSKGSTNGLAYRTTHASLSRVHLAPAPSAPAREAAASQDEMTHAPQLAKPTNAQDAERKYSDRKLGKDDPNRELKPRLSAASRASVDTGHIRDGISKTTIDSVKGLTSGEGLGRWSTRRLPETLAWPAVIAAEREQREQREARAAARHVSTRQGEQSSIAVTKESTESGGLEERSPARSRGDSAEKDCAEKCSSDTDLPKKGQISIAKDLSMEKLTNTLAAQRASISVILKSVRRFPTGSLEAPASALCLAEDARAASARVRAPATCTAAPEEGKSASEGRTCASVATAEPGGLEVESQGMAVEEAEPSPPALSDTGANYDTSVENGGLEYPASPVNRPGPTSKVGAGIIASDIGKERLANALAALRAKRPAIRPFDVLAASGNAHTFRPTTLRASAQGSTPNGGDCCNDCVRLQHVERIAGYAPADSPSLAEDTQAATIEISIADELRTREKHKSGVPIVPMKSVSTREQGESLGDTPCHPPCHPHLPSLRISILSTQTFAKLNAASANEDGIRVERTRASFITVTEAGGLAETRGIAQRLQDPRVFHPRGSREDQCIPSVPANSPTIERDELALQQVPAANDVPSSAAHIDPVSQIMGEKIHTPAECRAPSATARTALRKDGLEAELLEYEEGAAMQKTCMAECSANAGLVALEKPRALELERAEESLTTAGLTNQAREDDALTFKASPGTPGNDTCGTVLQFTVRDFAVNALPPSAFLTTAYTSIIFALISAIIRTSWISYLGNPLVGESTPYRLWAREGIGTCCLIF
ncbi:hypothetical protein B0H13DRAFT_1898194 [Mycena leptocephala]|nr:hypothetical protein B0H13DRAFT_1898194 [Mycena leptocephala]